jgi:DNA-binding response OmpR family regulator
MNILIVEDDKNLAELIAKNLQKNGHNATICPSIKKVIKEKLALKSDIILLDLLLEGERGEDLIKTLRKNNIKVPVLILSALSTTVNKVELLNMGADDYMTKPFDFAELLARIQALNKRYVDLNLKNREVHGDIIFYWKQNKAVCSGKEIYLTQKEKCLLELLVKNHDKVVSTEDILKAVWNVGSVYHSNILQSLIRYLRKKLENGSNKELIKNIHGVGYMISFQR